MKVREKRDLASKLRREKVVMSPYSLFLQEYRRQPKTSEPEFKVRARRGDWVRQAAKEYRLRKAGKNCTEHNQEKAIGPANTRRAQMPEPEPSRDEAQIAEPQSTRAETNSLI
jgi:hypothetical protein